MRGRGIGRIALLAVLCAVLALWLDLGPAPRDWIIPEPPGRVRAVAVRVEGREVRFERRGGSWHASASGELGDESAGPAYRGLSAPTADEAGRRLEWLLDRLCRRAPKARLTYESVEGPEFGLEPASLGLTISARDTYHLAIGGLNPAGDGRYFRLPSRRMAGLLARDLAGEIAALGGGTGPES